MYPELEAARRTESGRAQGGSREVRVHTSSGLRLGAHGMGGAVTSPSPFFLRATQSRRNVGLCSIRKSPSKGDVEGCRARPEEGLGPSSRGHQRSPEVAG